MPAKVCSAAVKKEAAYRLGMAMHRENPRRVLSTLRILPTVPRPRAATTVRV